MEQIERIRQMEQQFDKASAATKGLSAALDKYLKAQKAIQMLNDYYGSDAWKQDLWNGDNVWAYRCIGGLAESFADGGAHVALHTRSRATPLSSCRQYRRAHSSWMESSAPFIRGRRCLL